MNNITTMVELTNTQQTMTSLQIAEATGKNHAHVMRDIRNMVEKINESSRGLVAKESKSAREDAKAKGKYKGMSDNVVDVIFDTFNRGCSLQGYSIKQATYKDTKGEPRSIYILNKKASFLLASGYNHLLRMKIIDRWEDLEKQAATPAYQIPKSFTEALRLAADQQEQIEAQQRQIGMQSEQILQLSTTITSMEKKVTYMDRIFACPSTVKVTVIAQDYGMSAKAFNQLLHKYGLQYKCGEQWVLYAKYLPMGYVKDTPFTYVNTSGIENVKSNMQWTQKGRAFLYEFLKERGILPMIEQ